MDESKTRLSEQYAQQHPVVDPQTNAHGGGGGGGSERWNAALSNIAEIQGGIDTLQRLLLKQTVYKDEEAFSQVASHANQARHIMAQERRIRALEKELDAAIASAGLARAEKRLAEVAQRSAEARTQEVSQELENTTQVFKLHMEELRVKQEELSKKEADIKALQGIIDQKGGSKFEEVETLDTTSFWSRPSQ